MVLPLLFCGFLWTRVLSKTQRTAIFRRLCFLFALRMNRKGITTTKWTMLWIMLCIFCTDIVFGHVRYSIPEEMSKGSFVGNIAQDLGLDVKRLNSGKARIFEGQNSNYVDLIRDKGLLVVKERIDREALCGVTSPCSIHFEIVLDNPIEFHPVTIEILDVNDNAPVFPKDDIELDISESALPGARFVLPNAVDPDAGVNTLQTYALKHNSHFVLKTDTQKPGSKSVAMFIQTPLDREKSEKISLILTALDGGNPQLTGTAKIHINVLDTNDNPPVFTQETYRVSVSENTEKGTFLIGVSAVDADKGSNAHIFYSITKNSDELDLFQINELSGDISLSGELDYEKSNNYEINILATDGGGLTEGAKLIVDITDVNDNAPVVAVMSSSKFVAEDAMPNTVVAVVKVQDIDSLNNGEVQCNINDGIPFKITASSNNIYTLQTDAPLDREKDANYKITITACDKGMQSLCNNLTLSVNVSDINDNPPQFERDSYSAYVTENNSPGDSVLMVKASDPDWNQNARVTYSLEETYLGGVTVSSYVSINVDSGVIYAVRSFDYEQMKDFHFLVKALDGGSPPLSSNVSVKIIIQDQNDNTPQVLYPVQTSGSVVAELVPRSADIGYLVSKVVAVDVDSGQNAWLSYKLQKTADRALFEVGAQNGEIRTVRQVTDKDGVKQKLTVVVEDNGQPSRSATVTVNVAVADSFPEVLSEFTDFTRNKEYNDDLTFYLVLALAVVSFLFVSCLVAIISVKIYRWRHSRNFYQSNLPVIPYCPPHYTDPGGTGTLRQVYNYEVCMTTDSRKSDSTFVRPSSQNVLIMDPVSTETMQRMQRKEMLMECDSPEVG